MSDYQVNPPAPSLQTLLSRLSDVRVPVAGKRRSRPVQGTAACVRRLLIDRMGPEKQSVITIGREMGVSARTLSRWLADEGTSFRDIYDDVRRELALALLGEPSVTIAEIASFLGYAEPAPFHRSFKRWTGTTPALHRHTIR